MRELVKENKRDALLGTAFRLKLIGALLVLIALAFAVKLSHQDTITTLLIFIVASATVFQSFNIIDFYFQANVLSKYTVYANIISLFISSLIKVWLILNNAPLIAFAAVVLFDSMILMLGYVYFFQRHSKLNIKNLKFNKSTALNLLKDSWPLILSGFVVSIYMKIDQIMIKEMLNSEAVGQYAAAVRLSEAWYFIPMVIASSLFPAIINAKKHSEKLYYERLQKLYDLMVWIAIAIALPMTFLSDWVVNLLYGEQYNQAGSVLMIHIWAGIAVSFGIVWSKWILIENKQKITIVFHVLSMFLNIIYNLYFIPTQGIVGAGIATAFASLTAQFVGILTYKRKIAVKFLFNALIPIKLLR